MSNNLTLDQVAAAQNQKEVTINDQAGQIDAALTDAVTYLVTSTNARTLTALELQRFHFLTIDEDGGDPATAAITITVPAIKRGLFVVVNDTAFDVTVTVAAQPLAAPTVAAGKATLVSSDGVNVRQAGGASYDLHGFFAGTPAVSSLVQRFVVPRDVNFTVNFPPSEGHAGIAPSAAISFDIQKNSVSIGSMDFAMSATTATFSVAAATNLVAGDRLEVVAPANLQSLADLTFTLAGTL